MYNRSDIYLIYNFQKHFMDLMVQNIDLARKDMSNKLMIFGSDKNNGGARRKKVMSKKNQGLQHRGGKRK